MMTKYYLSFSALCVGGAVLISQAASAQVAPAQPRSKDRPAPASKSNPAPKPGETRREARKPAIPDDAKDPRGAAKERVKDVKDSAKERAKDSRDDTKDAAKDARDAEKDRTKNARDDANDRETDARDKAKDRAKDARDTAKDARDDVKDRANDARDDVKYRAKDGEDDATDVARDSKNSAKAARKFDAEKVKTSDLGLSLKDADDGVAISSVAKNSAFVDTGLRSGDQIVSINGRNISSQSDFMSYLFAPNVVSAGRVPLVVMRNGARDTIYVQPRTIIRNYETVVYSGRTNPVRDFGLVVDGRNDDRVYVERVIKDSRADHAGIQVDDQILAINDQPVETSTDLRRLLEKHEGERIDMEVDRDRQAKVIEVNVIR